MDILIGFEESQTVTTEFLKLGFNAFSCDLKACGGGYPERHLQMDIHEAFKLKKWGFIGLHPTCTKLTLTGNRHYGKGKEKHYQRIEAIEWTINLWKIACSISNKVYMENPMGALNSDGRLSKPQIIHPYFFGDEFQKQTCLWLYNLPPLFHAKQDTLFDNKTHVSKGEIITFASGRKLPKWYAELSTTKGKNSEKNRELRSKTFPGIAKAMASQWGVLLNNN